MEGTENFIPAALARSLAQKSSLHIITALAPHIKDYVLKQEEKFSWLPHSIIFAANRILQ